MVPKVCGNSQAMVLWSEEGSLGHSRSEPAEGHLPSSRASCSRPGVLTSRCKGLGPAWKRRPPSCPVTTLPCQFGWEPLEGAGSKGESSLGAAVSTLPPQLRWDRPVVHVLILTRALALAPWYTCQTALWLPASSFWLFPLRWALSRDHEVYEVQAFIGAPAFGCLSFRRLRGQSRWVVLQREEA